MNNTLLLTRNEHEMQQGMQNRKESFHFRSFESFLSLTAAILLTQVREPPYISQSNWIPNDTQEELQLVAPCCPIAVDVYVPRHDAVPVRSATLRWWRHNNRNARAHRPIVAQFQWWQLMSIS